MALYAPDGIHVGDDADPHGNGFTLVAYVLASDTQQGAICLVPKSRRLPYEPDNEDTYMAGGYWGGNYLTYFWDGRHFLEVVAHWNIVDAVNRYTAELRG